MKFYFLRNGDGAEPQRFTNDDGYEKLAIGDPAWAALSRSMAEILNEWLDAAANDGGVTPVTFFQMDRNYGNWDQVGGADGIEFPYTLVLPEAGIVPEQHIHIWGWPNPEDCEGHESLAGEHMGESVTCDGRCRSVDDYLG